MLNGCIYVKDMNIINLYLIINSLLHFLLYYSIYYIDISTCNEINIETETFINYIKNKKDKVCKDICCICLDDSLLK